MYPQVIQKRLAWLAFWSHGTQLQKIQNYTDDLRWNIVPRNKEQSFAYDLLYNDDISFVSLIGRAGSGKTFLAIAAGLEQTVGNAKSKYKKIVISRPVQPLGKRYWILARERLKKR